MNLDQIGAARAALAEQQRAQRAASAEHLRATTELDALRRSGADGDSIARAESQLAQFAEAARTAAAGSRQSLKTIASLSDELLRERDPGSLVEALATTHPVALLPVAVQTRYDDATTQLMIRIYPDALHGFTHEPGLRPNEVDEGKRYWTLRFADPADAASPWTQIARLFGPSRAAYVVRTTTPTNAGQMGQAEGPVFDDEAIPRAAASAQQVFAAALPDRFVAIGFRAGQQIFRKWGRAVTDLLPLSPLFDPLLMEDPKNTDPFAGDRAWMVDYASAEAAGMAITVKAGDLQGAQLGQGVERLMVLGVDWTQTPQSAGALLGSLLDNHQHSDGLAFVAQGTPTNNTGAMRAGFRSDGADVVAALDPSTAGQQAAAVADELASAGARLQLLLGVPKPGVGADGQPTGGFDAGLVPGATLLEGATAGHMVNALWNATIGYTLRFFWNPIDTSQTLIADASIDQLRAYAVRFLRPSGPLSALRVGNTPYGILPITARGFVPKGNSALEQELLEVLGWFRGHLGRGDPQRADPAEPQRRKPSPGAGDAAVGAHEALLAGGRTGRSRTTPTSSRIAIWQGLMLHFLVASLLHKQPFNFKSPFLATCAVRPKPTPLDAVPWVQRDPAQPIRSSMGDQPLARNFIAALLQILSQPTAQVRSALVAMENGESLLEAMLAFAGGRRGAALRANAVPRSPRT